MTARKGLEYGPDVLVGKCGQRRAVRSTVRGHVMVDSWVFDSHSLGFPSAWRRNGSGTEVLLKDFDSLQQVPVLGKSAQDAVAPGPIAQMSVLRL